MIPPPILLLQAFNMLMGAGCYLMAVTSFGMWSAAGWSPIATGTGFMVANLAYCVFVGFGGRLADGWGRARTAATGALIGCFGTAVAWLGADPWTSAIGTVLCFGGSALFFPGNVGLFSDARGAGGDHVPLHVKVSRYCMGWSGGNLVGFALAWGLADGHVAAGYLCSGGAFLVIALWLLRWWSMPPSPPQASGDRSDHPALPRLIRLGRVSIMLYCLMGMALISLLENTLTRSGLVASIAHITATAALTAYAFGYFSTFVVLGWWSGWVLRPWRLIAFSLMLPLAASGFLVCGLTGTASPWLFAGCGLLLGIAFAAIYTSSMYYSLRLPHGAARAASLHETFIGAGSTLGPLLGGGFTSWWSNGVVGLGVYLLIGTALVVTWQLSQMPAISRLLKTARSA